MAARDTRTISIAQLRRIELMIAPLRIVAAVAPLWLIYGMFRTLSQVDVSALYQPTVWLTAALVAAGFVRTAVALPAGSDLIFLRQAASAGRLIDTVRAHGLRSVLPTPTRLFALKLIDVAIVTPIALVLMMGFVAWGHQVVRLLTNGDMELLYWVLMVFGWSNALVFLGFVLAGIRRMLTAVRSTSEEDFRIARSLLSVVKH